MLLAIVQLPRRLWTYIICLVEDPKSTEFGFNTILHAHSAIMALSYDVFPVVSSITWGTTVSAMLIYWVAIGRPRYPTQLSEIIPFVAPPL